MADKTKTSRELKLVAAFVDGDDRTIAVADPKSDISKADVKAVAAKMPGVIIGDKTGADFAKVKSAKVVEQSTTYLDISPIV